MMTQIPVFWHKRRRLECYEKETVRVLIQALGLLLKSNVSGEAKVLREIGNLSNHIWC